MSKHRPAAAPSQSNLQLHRQLARFNQDRLRPALPSEQWRQQLETMLRCQLMEGAFVESARSGFAQAWPEVPSEVNAFMRWFEELQHTGPGQHHALFDWLATQANAEQMCWFVTQEVAGEAGFEDLVALAQIKIPVQAKLEMARNYWDEMGRGNEQGMHGGLLDKLVKELALRPTLEDTVWESLALANLMVALACNRRYAWQAIGALGVIEMTAPGRVSKVNEGLRRLGVSAAGRSYFQLHAGLDLRHSAAWNREVIRPLVAANPELAHPLAEGAWLRLMAGKRCFDRYSKALRVADPMDWNALPLKRAA